MGVVIGCFPCTLLTVLISFLSLQLTFVNCSVEREFKNKQPHIVLIIADDLVSTVPYKQLKPRTFVKHDYFSFTRSADAVKL